MLRMRPGRQHPRGAGHHPVTKPSTNTVKHGWSPLPERGVYAGACSRVMVRA